MRVALVGSAVLLVAAAVTTFACSSAQPAATGQADSGSTALPNNEPTPTNEGTGDPPPATDPGEAGVSDGAASDAGAGGFGSTDGDGGSRCLPTSIRESETNNDVANADQLQAKSQTFCGRITAGDVDFFTFTMPDQVGDFGFNLESTTSQNNLQIEPSADGEAFNFFGDYPFKPGKPYVIKISSKGAALEYRIRIDINQ